jgi:hypothetical protein
MSIRSEIRAALVDGPKSTDEMVPLVPSVEGDRARLGQNVSVLANELKVRRAGLSDDGRPLYQLDPKAWPAKGDAGEAVTVAAGRIEGPHLRKATPPPKPGQPLVNLERAALRRRGLLKALAAGAKHAHDALRLVNSRRAAHLLDDRRKRFADRH